jgi:hypothetical protein
VTEGMSKRTHAPLDGPGGYRCPCCGPAPKRRDEHRRAERRRRKNEERSDGKHGKRTSQADWQD